MNKLYTSFIFILISLNFFGQEKIYTSRKGLKIFPGHLEIVITLKKNYLKYELFNHWYTGSYAKLRDLEIPINEIQKQNNINFEIVKNGIYLKDEKYHINKKIKTKNLCTSLEKMRKISYAYEIAQKNKLKHFELYDTEDLKLSEEEFYNKVNENLKKNN